VSSKRTEHRNHHTVQHAYLKRFANAQEWLWQYDKQTGHVREMAAIRATGQPDFYTLRTANGDKSLYWETDILGKMIETPGKESIDKLLNSPSATVSDEDRERIAMWITMSALRTTLMRTHLEKAAADYQKETGRPLPLNAVSGDLSRNMDISKDVHILAIRAAFAPMAAEVFRRSWGFVRFATPELLTSDSPVANYHKAYTGIPRGEDEPIFAVPLSSEFGLLVSGRNRDDYFLSPDKETAAMFNDRSKSSADRYIYHNRDDAIDRFFPRLSKEELRKLHDKSDLEDQA
jgi:hypothetical protein